MSASTSRHTGTTECPRASDKNVSRSGTGVPVCISEVFGSGAGAEVAEEAAALARVARAAPLLLDDEQHDVDVAVVRRAPHELPVARRLALAPILLATTAPEPATT